MLMYILRSMADTDKWVSIGISEWPLSGAPIKALIVRLWPVSAQRRRPAAICRLDLGLLRHFESIIDLNAELPNRAFQLRMSKQELHSSQVFGAAINQGCLRSSHGVRPVACLVQSQLAHPRVHDACVLAGG